MKANQAKRILICSNVYPPKFIGGAELIAHYQAKELQRLGHAVQIFCGECTDSGARYTLRVDEHEGLPVSRIRLQPEDYSQELANFSHKQVEKHFDAVLDAFEPDVAHFHNLSGLSAGIIGVARRRGIRTIITLHDYWGFCHKNTLIKVGDQICTDFSRCRECMTFIREGSKLIPISMRRDFLAYEFDSVDLFVSPSEYLAMRYVEAGFPVQKMRVIWNGVDVERFSVIKKSVQSNGIRFTLIGYFGHHKGIDVLLDAVELLVPKYSFRLNLVGEGELKNHLQQRVERSGLQNVVRFWGKVENSRIEEVFAETDVLILPSIWPENQPVSITEAMASRTPVIATAIGGIPELIIDGYSGFLFKRGASGELAIKMREFMDRPDTVQLFGERAFEIISRHSFHRQVGQICELYV